MLSHRVRLHEELKRLATESEGEGNPVKLQVSSTVISIDCKSATVELADGTKETADLVLGADGVSVRDQLKV
jgi:2-polyprenyl-6-methoxyphenol hydroxylase-like FAD-dependent oxidoreductase